MANLGNQTITGSRAFVRINGQKVGTVNSFSYNTGINVIPVRILGNEISVELANVSKEDVTGSLSGFRLFKNSPFSSISFPQLQELLASPYRTLSLQDRLNPEISIFKCSKMRFTSSGTSVSEGGLMTYNIGFIAILEDTEDSNQFQLNQANFPPES